MDPSGEGNRGGNIGARREGETLLKKKKKNNNKITAVDENGNGPSMWNER